MSNSTMVVEAPEGTRYCVRHPDRQTLVSCGRCGRPFCTECLIHTPAGQRCYECAGVRRDYAQRAMARQFAQAFGAILLGAAISSLVGFFSIFIAFIAGGYYGQTLAPTVNRRTKPWIYLPIVLGLLVGALLGFTLAIGFRAGALVLEAPQVLILLAAQVMFSGTFLLFMAVAAIAAFMRLR